MKLMDGIWGQGRARGYGVTALMAVVVLGASVTARDALTSPASDEQPAGTVYETPTPAPTTPQEPAPQPVAPVVVTPDAPAAVTQAPTVQAVTEPQQQQPAAAPPVVEQPAPAKPYDPAAPWVDPASGKTFVPAPVPTMEKLPGEGETPPATN